MRNVTLVRLQAPLSWAARTLAAADPEGGPFVAAFDDHAQAVVPQWQADHLVRVSGLSFQVAPLQPSPVSEDARPTPPKRPHRKKE